MTYATQNTTKRWAAQQLGNVAAIAEDLTQPFGGLVMSIGCDSLTGAVRVEYELDDEWLGDPGSVAHQIATGLAAWTSDVRVEVYRGNRRWDATPGSSHLQAA